MDFLAARLGANMAISELTKSGQIGGEGGKVSLTSIHNTATETVDFPNKVNSIVGMEVTYTLPEDGYYFLHEPKVNRDEEYTVDIGEGDTHWFIANNTSGGVLNKRAFGIGGNVALVCPSFLWNYSGYTNIMYLYEDTSDNLGMGLTLPKGWYAVNTDTFAVTPFNLADNPVVIRNFDALEITYGNENVDFIKENWFELEKVRTFTIAEKNMALGALDSGGRSGVFIADMKRKNDIDTGDNIHMSVLTVILECLMVFAIEQGADGTFVRFSCDGGRANPPEQVTLTYSEGIKPIDPKFLVKTIDLATYGEGPTIADTIVALTSALGGADFVYGCGTFWEDVATDSPIKITYPFSTYNIEVSGVVVVKSGTSAAQLCFGASIYIPNVGAVNVNVIMFTAQNDGKEAVAVKVAATRID